MSVNRNGDLDDSPRFSRGSKEEFDAKLQLVQVADALAELQELFEGRLFAGVVHGPSPREHDIRFAHREGLINCEPTILPIREIGGHRFRY